MAQNLRESLSVSAEGYEMVLLRPKLVPNSLVNCATGYSGEMQKPARPYCRHFTKAHALIA